MFEVLETSKSVAEKSRHVQINHRALKKFSQELGKSRYPFPTWDAEHHFQGAEEETAAYLLVVDTINFCFWPPLGEERWEIRHRGKTYSGYYGLSVSLKKALESNVPLSEAPFLASLTLGQLRELLAGTGVLQLMEERLHNLNELGRVLGDKFKGRASEFIAASGGSAINLVRRLAADVPSFRDQTTYHGQEVFFYKRGQLLVADLYAALGGKGLGNFVDTKELTAFADYKLPQVLRHVGVFEYAPGLGEKVDRLSPLDPGSEEEVEIRANTIWAVELIRQEMKRLGKEVTASQIDWLLWNLGQEDRFRAKPYHRTVTIYY